MTGRLQAERPPLSTTLGGARWVAADADSAPGQPHVEDGPMDENGPASNLHDGLLREDVVASQYLGTCSCIFIRANHRKRKTEKEMEKSEPNMNVCIKVNTSSVLN